MCGIAGFTEEAFPLGGRRHIEAMTEALAHRGPDASGVLHHQGLWLGHTRLAIQDLNRRSDQPFRFADGALTYNGELWNAAELRDLLDAKWNGVAWRTSGDTEVLAALLFDRGLDALPLLDGQFAFCWSSPRERLLVRDRLGEMPLYVQQGRSGGLLWASERKALPEPGAAMPVPPGGFLSLDRGSVGYWHRPQEPETTGSPEEVTEALLRRGVSKRLKIADVPVCTLLSGGLDSSLIAAMAAQERPDLVAYCAWMEPDSADLAAARTVAEALGIELREVKLDPPDLEEVRSVVRTIEIPTKVAVEIALVSVQLARVISEDGFKVVLSGEAADEVFGGYGRLARRATSDAAWKLARRDAVAKMGRSDFVRANKSFMRYGVELRPPFCEADLVEYVLRLDRRSCPPGKRLLQRVAERFLPRSIVYRAKDTFQGGTGMRAACEERWTSPARIYNSLCRAEFGTLTRG